MKTNVMVNAFFNTLPVIGAFGVSILILIGMAKGY